MTVASESERQRVLSAVDRVAAAIEEHRDEAERERRLPESVIAAMREAELFSLWTAREYGGAEVALPTLLSAVETVSRADGSAGWVFANLVAGGTLAANLPQSSAREVYASSPNVPIAGSVIPRGRAVPAGGGYRLSGRWPLGSGSEHGDWVAVVGLVFDGDAPRTGPDGAPDLKNIFVKREDCQILDTWYSMGLRGTGSMDFTIDDAFVPEDRVYSLFTAQPSVEGPLYRIGILPLFSMALAAVPLGIARAAVDSFVALAREKTPTLSQTGLATRPTIHAEVARTEALVQSSRAYLHEVAGELMETVIAGQPVSEDLEARRRLACVNAATNSVKAVDAMFALAGSTPVYSGHRLERCLRDVHTAAQHLVVSPVWWEKTGQYYFGQGLGMP